MVAPRNRSAPVVRVGFVGVIAALVALTSCSGSGPRPSGTGNGLGTGSVSLSEVRSHQEAQLYYPGAQVFQLVGDGETSSSSAFAGAILTSTAGSSAIYSWYASWMESHGWTAYGVPRAGTQESAQGYERGAREPFIVAIDNPPLLSETVGRQVPGETTVFEISYLIFPAGG
jgi:hypothetical protein